MESGYARVFTKERNEQRRIIALEKIGGLTGRNTLIADIVLRLLSYVAQPKERPCRASGVAEKGDLRAGGRTEDACHPQNISQIGA